MKIWQRKRVWLNVIKYFRTQAEISNNQAVQPQTIRPGTSISGLGSKFNIMECLKEIDEKILGPNGKKDSGDHLDDKELLDGFFDGYNEALREDNILRIKRILCTFILTVLAVFVIYYLILTIL